MCVLCFEFHIASWGWLFVSVGFVTQQGKTDIIWPLPPTISCFGNGMSNKVTRRWDLESLELFMIPIETWSLLTCINSVNQGLFGHCFLSSNYIFRTAPTTHDDRKGKTKRIQEIQKELGPPNCEAIMNHYLPQTYPACSLRSFLAATWISCEEKLRDMARLRFPKHILLQQQGAFPSKFLPPTWKTRPPTWKTQTLWTFSSPET